MFKKSGLPRLDYSDRLAYIGCVSLERCRFIACLNMFFNVYNRHVTCDVLENFTANVHLSQLRGHNHRLYMPYCSCSIRKNFFTFRFLRIWNMLPTNIVNSNVTKAFAGRLKELDLDRFYVFRF